jgi:hypothetical protein
VELAAAVEQQNTASIPLLESVLLLLTAHFMQPISDVVTTNFGCLSLHIPDVLTTKHAGGDGMIPWY